jgi:calcineurin-like phosphoesterase family protein
VVWFTSDTHFGHPKVAEACGFGPSTAVYDATITQRWTLAHVENTASMRSSIHTWP